MRVNESPFFIPKQRVKRGEQRLLAPACRVRDFIIALIGLLLLSPFFVLIAVWIKRDSKGPVFYWGSRIGRYGRPFRILKFRTMYERPESYAGEKITGDGDPRITPIGRWLRNTKLNELPQLWNVLVGDMGLVGPRPEDPEFVKHWPEATRETLLSVRPGITSPASIIYSNEEKLLSSGSVETEYLRNILPDKLHVDELYVRNATFLTDLDVLFWTVITLIVRGQKYEIPRHALYWGPVARFVNRHFSWFVVDLLVASITIAIALLLWRSQEPLHLGWLPALALALGIAVFFSAINMVLGLNRVAWSKADAGYALGILVSTAIATGVLLFINYVAFDNALASGLLLLIGFFAYIGFLTARYRLRLVTGLATRWLNARHVANTLGERVLIVGAGEVGNFAVSLFSKGELIPTYHIVGLVDDDPRKQGAFYNGCEVLGTTSTIPNLVAEHDVGLLVFAITELEPSQHQRILQTCRQTGVRVVQLPDVVATLHAQIAPDAVPATLQRSTLLRVKHEIERIEQQLAAGHWQQARETVSLLSAELAVFDIALQEDTV
ncbi:MAG: sugar transferase [Anaerolineae bacterium]|nr:sugar transferase [Anaerolineae bacterium]